MAVPKSAVIRQNSKLHYDTLQVSMRRDYDADDDDADDDDDNDANDADDDADDEAD